MSDPEANRVIADYRAKLRLVEADVEEGCPVCGSTTCEDPAHVPPTAADDEPAARVSRRGCAHVPDGRAVCTLCGVTLGLDLTGLHDATVVAARGRAIAEAGVPWLVDGLIPTYGMLGLLIAYAKVGKTTFGHALGAAVSRGEDFIGRKTRLARVLYLAAEDPPEYTDYLARHVVTEPGRMTFFEQSVLLSDDGLARVAATVKAGGYGLVLIASWQAVIRGLVRDENDNSGAVVCVERVKAATRETKIPWLIDAHSGRSEDQHDDADPTKALRGASAAAGAADYLLSLRYADGAFGHRRRLSGRGRFVTLAPQTIEYDQETGRFSDLGSAKGTARESTWIQIETTGALTAEWRTAQTIATAAGILSPAGKVTHRERIRVAEALRQRPGVAASDNGQTGRARRVSYRLAPEEPTR